MLKMGSINRSHLDYLVLLSTSFLLFKFMATNLPENTISSNEILAFQTNAPHHISFSLTEACPLCCRHCIISSVSIKNIQEVTLTIRQAEIYSEQLQDMKKDGVDFVSFTGGEPLLAPKQLKILSKAAYRAGIECTVITSCFWSKTKEVATRVINRFPFIQSWHYSIDSYHNEFVPINNIINASEAARKLGRDVSIRMTSSSTSSLTDQHLYNTIRRSLPESIPIFIQPARSIGRGEKLDIYTETGNWHNVPCLSNGLFVHVDGTPSPCCSSLVGYKTGHPFIYSSAIENGLHQVYQQWRTDPVLQLICAVGFEPVLYWVRENLPNHPILQRAPDHPCEVCIELWKYPKTAELIYQKCRLPDTEQKIHQLFQSIFSNELSCLAYRKV